MHPTAGQLSGRNSAESSRFAKSVAYTIATSDGRPDPVQSVRHARAGPPSGCSVTTPSGSANESGGVQGGVVTEQPDGGPARAWRTDWTGSGRPSDVAMV